MSNKVALGWAALAAAIAVIWGIDHFAIPWVDDYTTDIMVRVGFNLIAVCGLTLVLGFTGQFSLGHAGFMAVGAYTAAVLARDAGTPLPVNVLAGGVAAALAGVAVGVPSLRLTGDYLAVVTLGFNFIIITIIENTPFLGGAQGISIANPTKSFGWTFTCVLLAAVVVRNLRNSAHGRVLEAVRDNEVATRSLGINTTRAKVMAFAIGAFFAGVAGALFAHKLGFIRGSQFAYDRSIDFLAMVVLGGTGSLSGPLLAGVVLSTLPEILRPIADYRMVIYSLLLIGMMILRPAGLLGRREIVDLFRRRKAA